MKIIMIGGDFGPNEHLNSLLFGELSDNKITKINYEDVNKLDIWPRYKEEIIDMSYAILGLNILVDKLGGKWLRVEILGIDFLYSIF